MQHFFPGKAAGALPALLAAVGLCTTPLLPAQAVTIASPSDDFTVNFNGFPPNESVIPGLTATAFFDSTSGPVFDGTNTTFTFTVTFDNVSVAPITASRLTAFAFDTTPDVAGVTTTSAIFDTVKLDDNLPGNTQVEVCVTTGNCTGGGSGGDGLQISTAPDVFTLTLGFAGNVSSFQMTDFFVRWQGIEAPSLGIRDGSAIGSGTIVSVPPTGGDDPAVPEPTSNLALLALGAGLGGLVYRRRVLSAR